MPYTEIQMLHLFVVTHNGKKPETIEEIILYLKGVTYETIVLHLLVYYLTDPGNPHCPNTLSKDDVFRYMREVKPDIPQDTVRHFLSSPLLSGVREDDIRLNFSYINKHMSRCSECNKRQEFGRYDCPNTRCKNAKRKGGKSR